MNLVTQLQSIPFFQTIDSIIKPPFEINPIVKFVAQEHNLVANIPSKLIALLCNNNNNYQSSEAQQNQLTYSVLLRIFNEHPPVHKAGVLEDCMPTGLVVRINGKLAFSVAVI